MTTHCDLREADGLIHVEILEQLRGSDLGIDAHTINIIKERIKRQAEAQTAAALHVQLANLSLFVEKVVAQNIHYLKLIRRWLKRNDRLVGGALRGQIERRTRQKSQSERQAAEEALYDLDSRGKPTRSMNNALAQLRQNIELWSYDEFRANRFTPSARKRDTTKRVTRKLQVGLEASRTVECLCSKTWIKKHRADGGIGGVRAPISPLPLDDPRAIIAAGLVGSPVKAVEDRDRISAASTNGTRAQRLQVMAGLCVEEDIEPTSDLCGAFRLDSDEVTQEIKELLHLSQSAKRCYMETVRAILIKLASNPAAAAILLLLIVTFPTSASQVH